MSLSPEHFACLQSMLQCSASSSRAACCQTPLSPPHLATGVLHRMFVTALRSSQELVALHVLHTGRCGVKHPSLQCLPLPLQVLRELVSWRAQLRAALGLAPQGVTTVDVLVPSFRADPEALRHILAQIR